MTSKKLRELEEMAAELLEQARELPPGPDRQQALKTIGSFVTQIASMKRSSVSRKIEIK
jgi:hypothetical protein